MVLSDHPAILASLQKELVIAYLDIDALPCPDWVVQDIDTPITILQGMEKKYILAHVSSLDRSTLVGLDDRVSALTADLINQLPPQPTETSRKRPRTDEPKGPEEPKRQVNGELISFPGALTYVSEIAPGLKYLIDKDFKGKKFFRRFSDPDAFPGYKVTSATAYRYKVTCRDAANAGILQKFIDFGRTEEGKWAKLVEGEYQFL